MSEETNAQQQIDLHRAVIDSLDEQIVDLLNKRAERSLAIRALKPEAKLGLYDPKREEEIFERLEESNKGPMFDEDIRAVYTAILRVMKELRS